MTLDLLSFIFTSETSASILALITLAISITVFVMILRNRHSQKLRDLESLIESIPFVVGLVPLSFFFTDILHIASSVSSIPKNGNVDPLVVASGFEGFFTFVSVFCGLFLIFLQAWIIMRMLYGKYIRELDTVK